MYDSASNEIETREGVGSCGQGFERWKKMDIERVYVI